MCRVEFFNRKTGETTHRTYKRDWWQSQAIARSYANKHGLIVSLIMKEY